MAKKDKPSTKPFSSDILFGEEGDAAFIPMRGAANKYDAVLERAQSLHVGRYFPFQAPSTSSLMRLKKRLSAAGYRLTTRSNPDDAAVNPGGVTAYVVNDVGKGVAPMSGA
jgi:hypothetical protein